MPLPPASHLAWKICVTFLHFVAFIWTGIRLRHRWKSQLWWDDYLISITLVFDIFYLFHLWFKYKNNPILWTTPSPAYNFFWSAWFTGFLYATVVWFAKMALMLSIARIFSGRARSRQIALALTAFFFAMYLAFMLITALGCERLPNLPWYIPNYGKCIMIGKEALTVIFGYIIDFLADLILIIFSFFLVKTMRMRPTTRFLLKVIFSGSFLTLSGSIVSMVFFYKTRMRIEGRLFFVMSGHMQASLSLIIANLLVDVVIFYRFFHKGSSITTVTDGQDDEVITDSREVLATQTNPASQPYGNARFNPSSLGSDMGQLTLTSIHSSEPPNTLQFHSMPTFSRAVDRRGLRSV